MKRKRTIALLPGDGIGPEVVQAAREVLQTVAACFDHRFEFREALIGHAAIEASGDPLPDETLALCRESDAVLLGAVGDPRYDADPTLKVRPEQGLLRLRKELGLFANLRPIRLFDELLFASTLKPEILRGVDILFFRELTGGIYFGQPSERREGGEAAVSTMVYTKEEVRRIARMAFEAAQRRRRRVHSIDKANVLEVSRLWREVVQEVGREFPDVELVHMYVDNAAMQLIRDPRQFDVVLTGNMFGDILTDEASQIAGSLGMLPSASVGAGVGLYEPVHGSAPDIAGKGIANPLATILSAALMLEMGFGLHEEAEAVVLAVEKLLRKGYRTADLAQTDTPTSHLVGTREATRLLIDELDTVKNAVTVI